MSSTENPDNNVHNIDDSTKAVDEANDITPKIRTPKRIRPEKQNNKQDVFDQLKSGFLIHSSISKCYTLHDIKVRYTTIY